MDIRLKTTGEGVHIWLPVKEAVRFIKKPRALQDEIATMLRAGRIDPDTGDPLEPLGFGIAMGPRPGSDIDLDRRSQRGASPKQRKKQKKIKCDYCERMIAEGSMNRHIGAAHPEREQP